MGMRVPAGLCRRCLKKVDGGGKWCDEHRPPSKYRATRTAAADGTACASRKEARRYAELLFMQANGLISGLATQKSFDLVVNGVLVCRYRADFTYREGGADVTEDVKSEATRKNRAYVIKRKLMLAVHGITIKET